MRKMSRKIFCLLTVFCMLTGMILPSGSAAAKETEGKVSETANYKIYPTPQKVTDENTQITLSEEINVIKESGIDKITENRINEVLEEAGYQVSYSDSEKADSTNLYVGINGSGESADTHENVPKDVFAEGENKYDMHVLKVFEDGDIVILGKDTDAAFYALATLEQMFAQSESGTLKVSTFEDYAFQKYRGAVEGYYGYPWSVEGTLDWMEFAKRYKMNMFLYGPKSDPYHLGKWDEEYPEEVSEEDSKNGVRTKDEMRQYAEAAAASKVSFVWVAHPAMQKPIDFTNEETIEEGLVRLMDKFSHMYDLGVRQFGIFVDDISESVAAQTADMQVYMLNEIQNRLYEKYNGEGQSPEDQVKGLFFTPAWYTTGSSYGASCLPKFKAVHEDVEFCFTGNAVFSNISNSSATTFKNWLGRTPVMWWNYPVNDASDAVFYTNPINHYYGQDSNPTNLEGVLSNPMNYAEASKVAFFGLADYTWNPKAFDAMANWEDSFRAMMPDDADMAAALREAYGNLNQTFVPADVKNVLDGYQSGNKASAAAIRDKMYTIMDAIKKVETLAQSERVADQLIVEEAQTSFNKLYDMAALIGGAMATVSSDDPVDQVHGYYIAQEAIERLDTPKNERYQIISLEGAGEDIYSSVVEACPSERGLEPFMATAREVLDDFAVEDADTSGVAIEQVNITPNENVEVRQGTTQQFLAAVDADRENVNEVLWSVEGAEAEGTSINKNGVLTVDTDETARELNVTATSVYDKEKSETVKVTVIDKIYTDPTIPVNLGPQATILHATGSPAQGEGPEYAFDDNDSTKWCTGGSLYRNQWLAFDLGAVKTISEWQMVGGGIEHELYTPSAFSLQVLKDENPTQEQLADVSYLGNNDNWETVSEYTNNTENDVRTDFDPAIEGRYFRFYVANAIQPGAPYPSTRIFELRVFGVDKATVERTHSLTIDSNIKNGTLAVDAAHFEEGAKVNIQVLPDENYQLKPGSLTYNGTQIEGTSFLMPGEDVVLSAAFEPISESKLSTDVLEYTLGLAATADTEGVLQSVVDRFQKAVENGQDILDRAKSGDASVTQEMIDEAWKEIITSMQYLSFKQGNKEDLQKVYDMAANLDLDRYLEEGKEAFRSALTLAESVLSDGDAMQDEVNGAWKTLLSAMSELRLKPDKSALNELIVIAMSLKEDDYEAEGFAVMRTALAEATAVYKDETATEETVAKATANLQDALSGLKQASAEDTRNTQTSTNTNANTNVDQGKADTAPNSNVKSVKTGDETVVVWLIFAMAMEAGICFAQKKKMK